MLQELLEDRRFQRLTLATLRRFVPLLRWGKFVVVSRYESVTDVLARPDDFSVRAIYEDKMRRTSGAFYLGMDDTPQYRREREITDLALRALDVSDYTKLASGFAEDAIENRSAATQIDVVQELSWLVPLRLCEEFFGVTGPEMIGARGNVTTDRRALARWSRYIFQHLFLNLGDDAKVAERAEDLSLELVNRLDGLIAQRQRAIALDETVPKDFLTELCRLGAHADTALSDEGIRRNVGGVILGSVDTISKCVVNVLDELLQRPESLESARQAAVAGDREQFAKIAFEALRFYPHNPLVVRRAIRDAIVRTDSGKELRVRAGDQVFAMTYAAMFDPAHLQRPQSFDVTRRDLSHLQFGFGMHRCFGERLALSAVPEILMPLLRRGTPRRIKGPQGKVVFDGPFPDHFVVSFEPDEAMTRGRAA